MPAALHQFGIPVCTNSFIEWLIEPEQAKCSKGADKDAGWRASPGEVCSATPTAQHVFQGSPSGWWE